MYKILLSLILSLSVATHVQASEIFGLISTNPDNPAGHNQDVGEPAGRSEPTAGSTGSAIPPVKDNLPDKVAAETIIPPASQVLGGKIYADGCLLRGPDHKIYLLQGKFKKLIINLVELKKYRGQEIIKVSPEDLAGFQTRQHLNGELIRRRGDVRVYEIVASGKKHILNPEELRADYFGLEIHNISREEMELY